VARGRCVAARREVDGVDDAEGELCVDDPGAEPSDPGLGERPSILVRVLQHESADPRPSSCSERSGVRCGSHDEGELAMQQLGVVVMMSLALVGACKQAGGDDAKVKEFEGFRDKMCACTDAACATQVVADWRTWREGTKGMKPEGDLKVRIQEIDHAFHACERKVGGSAALAPATPAPPQAAGATPENAVAASASAPAASCHDAAACRPACDGGDQGACVALGKLMQSGTGVGKDARGADTLFKTACDKGDARGCVEAALDRLDGTGVLKDAPAGAALMTHGCELGSATACGVLGTLQVGGEGLAKDPAAAAISFRKACDGKNFEGCLQLGSLTVNGTGVTKDTTAATALFQLACDHKKGDACMMLGYRYIDGDGAPKDARRAVESFQIGCDDDSAKACYALGLQYQTGVGVAVDKAQAKLLFTKACTAGLQAACDMNKPPRPASGGLCSGFGSWSMTCGGSCVNTYNDRNNCGGCGASCNGSCDVGRCS
jgi:TPR repeat protein